MQAIVRDAHRVELRDVAPPVLEAPDDVLLQVAYAGICRTDVYAAQGLLPVRVPCILGHELSGRVLRVGAQGANLQPGDRVAVLPALPCGGCDACRGGSPHACSHSRLLGVEVDGAFAEQLRVPARALFVLPASLSLRVAAYLEPVAAALAVTQVALPPGVRVGVMGTNRIAALTHQILTLHQVHVHPLDGTPRPELDVVVETGATAALLEQAVAWLRPGGTLVLKSRPHHAVPLPVRSVVEKQLTLRGVRYAPFPDALALLASGRLDLSALLGDDHPLHAFARLLLEAPGTDAERTKQLFRIAGE